MLIDAASAKALAAIIFISTQGIDSYTPQLPLQIEDRGKSWLVKGTPYTDEKIGSRYIASFVFIEKTNAQVIGIGSDARIIPTEEGRRETLKYMSRADYARITGPRRRFEPGGSDFKVFMDMSKVLYGGLVNKPDDAVAYAHILMQTKPGLAAIPAGTLKAEERAKVWHITKRDAPTAEIMSFSREDGKVLSGDL